MISVLVCEDSPPVSQLLVKIINADPELLVAGVAGNGREALELNHRLRPDVIAMDVRMPVLNGLEATRQIMSEQPVPIVLVSELADVDVNLSMDALKAGALIVLSKPHGPDHPEFQTDARRLCQTLINLSKVKLVRRWVPGAPGTRRSSPVSGSSLLPASPQNAVLSPLRPRLVAIGASTGGPSALATLLSKLPPSFNLPVLVTQHIMPGFGSGMARWLRETTGRRAITAEEGMLVEPESGLVIVSPDHCHMLLAPSWQIYFDHRGPVNGIIPSVDVMFESVAHSAGARSIGVILTGMGKDGAHGLSLMRQTGAYTIAQDESSAVVFGMPKEAIALNAACTVLPLEQIAADLVRVLNYPYR